MNFCSSRAVMLESRNEPRPGIRCLLNCEAMSRRYDRNRILPGLRELLERNRCRGPVVDVVHFLEVGLEGPESHLLSGEVFPFSENHRLVDALAGGGDALEVPPDPYPLTPLTSEENVSSLVSSSRHLSRLLV